MIEHEHAGLRQDIDRIREEVTGDLVIAASTVPGEVLLLPVLSSFQALHPVISIQVEISDSLEVISRIQVGDYDVGFCGMAPEGKELEYFKFAEDEIVLIVFPEHPFAKRKNISFTEMEREPLISREATSGYSREA